MTGLLLVLGAALAADNPHQPGGDCAACHVAVPAAESTLDGDAVVPAPAVGALKAPAVALCRSCHPDADMHPVGVVPQQTRVPAGWPLEDGAVTCATCHVEPAHGTVAVAAPYHRGGPYSEATGLCFRCHDRAEHQRQDPHHGEQDNGCTACHTSRPVAGAVPAEARLRQEGSGGCQGCHGGVPHVGVVGHLGKALPAGVRLPSDGGKIACWTCHDVHQYGVLEGPSVAPAVEGLRAAALGGEWSNLPGAGLRWPGEGEVGHPGLLAAPLGGGGLCRTCHGEGP
jgi:hypothetical protein